MVSKDGKVYAIKMVRDKRTAEMEQVFVDCIQFFFEGFKTPTLLNATIISCLEFRLLIIFSD
jgi:hypothetical protein